MYRSPNDVYIDEWVYELLELVETTGATRVMIDSLSDLQYATPDPIRFREFIYSLTQRLSRAGISPIMTSEIPDLFHVGRLAEYGISHLSDNVILLQYLRAESRLLRTVTILKSRASAHDPEIREFEITARRHRPRRPDRRRAGLARFAPPSGTRSPTDGAVGELAALEPLGPGGRAIHRNRRVFR